MQLYECISACAVVAAATGIFPKALYSNVHVRPFTLCYAGILMLTLGRFSLAPIAEFRCNMAALCLPLYFLILFSDARRTGHPGKSFWRGMFLCAMLPVAWVLVSAIAVMFEQAYISVDIGVIALLNAQAILCTAMFLYIPLRYGRRKRRRPA